MCGKVSPSARTAKLWASDIQFWNQVMANKDSHAGYKYAYEMAKDHYHGGGSPWAQGAGSKAKRAYEQWAEHDRKVKEAERHAKAVGVAQESAKVKLMGDLQKLQLSEQEKIQKKKAQLELLKQAKQQARRAKAQAQFGQVTRPKRIKRQKRRTPSPKPQYDMPKFDQRPRRKGTSLTDLW